MRLEVRLRNINRPPEQTVFLATHFRDAVLDYYPNVDKLLKEKRYNTWEWSSCMNRGRLAIYPFLTDKERARLVPELNLKN